MLLRCVRVVFFCAADDKPNKTKNEGKKRRRAQAQRTYLFAPEM